MLSKHGFRTTPARSDLMRKIRSRNTSPEILLRRSLKKSRLGGLSFSNDHLPGKPDIAMRRTRIAIFVDGDFWHGYKWKAKKNRIKSNKEYWVNKIERNIRRDRRNNLLLQKLGWTVIRIWEHQLKRNLDHSVDRILLSNQRQHVTKRVKNGSRQG